MKLTSTLILKEAYKNSSNNTICQEVQGFKLDAPNNDYL